MLRCLCIAALVGFGLGCGGASSEAGPESSETALPPPGHFGIAPSFQPLPVDIGADEPLDDAFARVRQAYTDTGIETFDPRRAYTTSPARDFAWYFTVNDPYDPFERTNHVFFVASGAWDIEQTRSFLLSYLVMPGAPLGETGRLWFHFYTAHELPFAVRYLFANTVQGALEAAILTELGTTRWDAAEIEAIVQRVDEIFVRFGLEPPATTGARCPRELDAVYSSLPRPPADERDDVFGRQFSPEGTLAAIGVAIGEFLRHKMGDTAEWENDDASIYPRLRISSPEPGILHPVQMMIELYLAEADILPSDYCRRMLHNLIDSGTAEVPLGD